MTSGGKRLLSVAGTLVRRRQAAHRRDRRHHARGRARFAHAVRAQPGQARLHPAISAALWVRPASQHCRDLPPRSQSRGRRRDLPGPGRPGAQRGGARQVRKLPSVLLPQRPGCRSAQLTGILSRVITAAPGRACRHSLRGPGAPGNAYKGLRAPPSLFGMPHGGYLPLRRDQLIKNNPAERAHSRPCGRPPP